VPLRLLYLIFVRLCSWLVLLGRSSALILVAGVTALSLARSVRFPQLHVGSPAYWPFAAATIAFLAFAFAELGRRRPRNQQAILTGTSAGLIFGIADALTRRTVPIIDTGHPATLRASWPATR
jgi:amino acid transporter